MADKREGYGYYQWADNRRFKGWWYENKQHGPGTYFSPEASTVAKFGIWQMSKRIKWLSEQECEDIANAIDKIRSNIKKVVGFHEHG